MKIIEKMRRVVSILLAMVLITLVPGEQLRAAELKTPTNLGAHHAYAVMDANSGTVLLSARMNKKIYPASTVKIMTAIIAVERMKLTTEIKVKKKVIKNISAGAAKYGLQVGKKYTLKNLLYVLLLVSGADAAQVIADAVGGSVDDFVEIMNAKAAALGMTGSHFDNPIGLDVGDGFNKTYATAYDYCLLTKYAMQNQKFRNIVQKTYHTVKRTDGTTERRLTNTNRFYTMVSYNHGLYQVIGTKTGTTDAAGHVFIATAIDDEGHEVICAYYSKVSSTQLFSDIRKLLNTVFKADKKGKIALAT